MTTEPQPLATAPALTRLQAALKARGIDVEAAPDPERVETPAERSQRLLEASRAARTRWGARVPAMYAQARLADVLTDGDHLRPDQAQSIQAFQASMGGHPGPLNLVLAGPVGTGKTHAAYALGNQAALAGLTTEAWAVVDLLEAMRPSGDAQAAYLARRARLLVLDDLGAQKASEWAVEAMTGLLDERVRENRHTVVTTNVPEPDLEGAWGGRFMDRLRYRRAVAVFHGESRRAAAW